MVRRGVHDVARALWSSVAQSGIPNAWDFRDFEVSVGSLTGGTAMAATELLRMAGARVDHALFVIDLPDLGGASALRSAGLSVEAIMHFAGESGEPSKQSGT